MKTTHEYRGYGSSGKSCNTRKRGRTVFSGLHGDRLLQDFSDEPYVFTVTYEAKEPAYVVDFTDIADIITSGESLGEAFNNGCEALDLHLESLQKLGKR